MREIGRRFSAGWCRAFHPKPFWPIHGHYQCPRCLRTYPVPWSEGDRFNRASVAGTEPNPFTSNDLPACWLTPQPYAFA